MNMIRKVLKQRLASPEQHHGDILDHVIQDMNALDFLTMDFVVQLFFGLLFALSDSMSKMTTLLTLKLLDDYPDVLQELIVCFFFKIANLGKYTHKLFFFFFETCIIITLIDVNL